MKYHRTWKWLALTAFVISFLILTACAPAAPPTSAPVPATSAPAQATTAPAAAVKDTLVVGVNSQPAVLFPPQAVGRFNDLVNALMFDAFTARDPQGNLAPALAQSWKRVDDLTWEFKLRSGVKFQNGDSLTSDDVKFTYEQLVLAPEAKSTHLTFLSTIKQIDVTDPTTFRIITKTPDVILPSRVFDLYGGILPMKYYQQVGDAAFRTTPIGSGPFKFASWVKDSQMTLTRNEDYWGPKPGYKTLVLRFITDDAARMAAYLAGELDIASNVPPERVDELKANPKLDVRSGPSSRYYFLTTDTTQKPFSDVRVRQALNLALDRDALIKGVSRGFGTSLGGIFIPQTFGYDPAFKPVYDVNKAKQLLTDAGYPNGIDVTFNSFTGSIIDHSKVSEAIAAQLAKAGIRTTLNVVDYGVFGPKRLAHQEGPLYIYSLGDWAFDQGVNLKSYVEGPQGSQGYFYSDQALADKIDKALALSDDAQRAKAYSEIQKDFYDKAIFGSVYQVDQVWGVAKNVDWNPQPDEMLRFQLAKPK